MMNDDVLRKDAEDASSAAAVHDGRWSDEGENRAQSCFCVRHIKLDVGEVFCF